MVEIAIILYFAIGILLTIFWWNRNYKKSYEEAKNSTEGVEKGMVEILLLVLLFMWPVVMVYKLFWRDSSDG